MAVLQDTVKTGIYKPQARAERATTSSPKRLARIAGLLYLVVGVFGGFAVAYVSPMLYVPGDAAATVGKVLANADLVRLGVLADLLQATVSAFVSPELSKAVHLYLAIAPTIAEVGLLGFLLVFGVRTTAPDKRSAVAVTAG